ncbi:MAG: hypothetical protein HND58_04655 [Planctomycetota bacterium]|nr:MAG: hypothetical protein HND58_04655 [Planctomycetota bacterium]
MSDSKVRPDVRSEPEEPGDYALVFSVPPLCLHDHEPDSRVITRIDVEIVCDVDPQSGFVSDTIPVGSALAYRIDGDECSERGWSLWDACDAFEQETTDYCEVLFGRKNWWTPEVEAMCPDVWSANLLILSEVRIDPAHRGKRLGLRAARVLMDLFPVPGGLVACLPRPMRKPERATPGMLVKDDEGTKSAIRALTQYWGRMGFQPLGETGYCVLDPALRAPRLNDL